MKRSLAFVTCSLCIATAVFAAPQEDDKAAPPDTREARAARIAKMIAKAKRRLRFTEISLQRMQGFENPGAFPLNYTITLRSNGTATAVIEVKGENKNYMGYLSKEEFYRVVDFLEESGYFEMEPLYSADMTDLPTIITSVVRDGKRKEVRDYGHAGPDKLLLIETLIRGLAAGGSWGEVPPSTPVTKK